MLEKVVLEISWLFGRLLLVADFDLSEVVLVFSLEALNSPLELLLSDLSIHVIVEHLNESLYLPEVEVEAVILYEFKNVFDANPVMPAAVDGHNNSLRGIPLTREEVPPKLDQLHLSSHNFENHLSEDSILLQNSLLLTLTHLGVLQSLSDHFPQLQVIPRQEKGRKLESADFSHFKIVHPGEGVCQKFSMGGADNFVDVLFAEEAFFVPVEEAEQPEGIKIRSVCEGLSERLNCLVEQQTLDQQIGKGRGRFDGKSMILIVGHSRLLLILTLILLPFPRNRPNTQPK